MQPAESSQKDYLYYVIRDNDQKVRGNIIGTQHSVKPKDKELNPQITEAIKRSSQAFLEMPPQSKLIPTDSKADWIIGKAITHIKASLAGTKKIIPILETQVNNELKNIQKKTSPENFQKLLDSLKTIESSEEKLKFMKEIQKNLFDFNLVSLEENINKKIDKNKVKPLEDIDLAALLKNAGEKTLEKDVPQFDEQASITQKAVEKGIYKAWANGDAETLTKLLNQDEWLNKEPPEYVKVQAPRNKNIANRITEVVQKAKDDNNEVVFVFGCAHLLYSKPNDKNVLDYLNDRFKTDMKGWTITQVKGKN